MISKNNNTSGVISIADNIKRFIVVVVDFCEEITNFIYISNLYNLYDKYFSNP